MKRLSSQARVLVYWLWFGLPFVVALLAVGWPWSVLVLHGVAGFVLARAWWKAAGTALRPALLWGVAAQGLITWAFCLVLGSWGSGRVAVGGFPLYLASLSGLAFLVSVLNARRPGAGAWAWLMVLMVVVFQIPKLEAHGLDLGAILNEPARLEMPWTLFVGLLIAAGVGNFVGTSFTIRAIFMGWMLYECLIGSALAAQNLPRSVIVAGVVVPLLIASSVLWIDRPERNRIDGLWLWFRDHWGVVWAVRVMERFNREAEVAGWSYRLGWNGVIGGEATEAELVAGALVLRGLLRRFAEGWKLDEVMRTDKRQEDGVLPMPYGEEAG